LKNLPEVIDRTESQLFDKDRANRQRSKRQKRLERLPPRSAPPKAAALQRYRDGG
jgi:hypothetical protein